MTSKKRVMTKVEKRSGGQAMQMELSNSDQAMVIDEDAETTPHWSSSLTPPLPSSPMQAPSALPSSSKDDIKNEFFSLLFTNRMDNLLKGAMVVLLTCRWLVEHKQSFQDLQSSLHQ
ncbi:hypothetical protein PAXRUDRAFT_18383 [Paxillus rubicundulus Ve08.2h10]|uniref:Unplaced genomic scaffold scaffold_2799, whole genome shotgun sequence n=1 Tax=Paxillus rubicundulus Ve08.2h10 TaxID=930991 RepID=A0A0D0BYE0_9AGAM|nr:hypothetical protein PAXRUDRAFT_18383 [Paxillus rubicundulus Ve08.2h10]